MTRFALTLALLFVASCDLPVAWGVHAAGFGDDSSPRGPEETCARACRARAGHCSHHECARGCNLVIDRLVEHEGDRVIACVARASASCDDRTWSACATRIGVYADGGPPAPPPSQDVEEE